ncbi:tRNA (adenosine(37)-N6)-threonylcarbamoyltransferase complex ATPase subunit type 1 TsaE [Panacagrimonas sp.]|uniref:tRNA (adenosine(37)-N6)-threonylcarbamoyltransferase complex ATPase subunit type 1 TsaE n=1 Tax=Panacagrimonas sp. TaxID=2480088 RepID=UPI003B5300AC
MMRLILADEAATLALGARLAAGLLTAGGGVVYLYGDLGAGKTTLARGLLRAAGVQGTLRSPTYTLLEPYAAADQRLLHLDLYRLVDPEEVEYLGVRDYPPDSTVWLVEWPQRGLGHLPPADVVVRLQHDGPARLAELEWPSGRVTFDQVTFDIK